MTLLLKMGLRLLIRKKVEMPTRCSEAYCNRLDEPGVDVPWTWLGMGMHVSW
jgi:hypothetical protein